MASMISVVINAQNVEKDLPKAITSIKSFANEVVVINQDSVDKTAEIAKKLGAKVFNHKSVTYVELARNFGLEKAKSEWILVLDPDEEVPPALAKKIKEIVKKPEADYYRIPRKNIIFGKWIRHTRWWPDYNVRLFRKGAVSWTEIIHRVPLTQGKGADIPEKEEFALIHNNYRSLDEYLEKMFRYSKVQAGLYLKNGYKFDYRDLVSKPTSEFLSRFFVGQGYRDGLHGLVLSILQAFSEFLIYVRIWGEEGFREKDISKKEFGSVLGKGIGEIRWWIRKEFSWLKSLLSA